MSCPKSSKTRLQASLILNIFRGSYPNPRKREGEGEEEKGGAEKKEGRGRIA